MENLIFEFGSNLISEDNLRHLSENYSISIANDFNKNFYEKKFEKAFEILQKEKEIFNWCVKKKKVLLISSLGLILKKIMTFEKNETLFQFVERFPKRGMFIEVELAKNEVLFENLKDIVELQKTFEEFFEEYEIKKVRLKKFVFSNAKENGIFKLNKQLWINEVKVFNFTPKDFIDDQYFNHPNKKFVKNLF